MKNWLWGVLIVGLLIVLIAGTFLAPFYVSGWDRKILEVTFADAAKAKAQLWLISVMAQGAVWTAALIFLAFSWLRLRRLRGFWQAFWWSWLPFAPILAIIVWQVYQQLESHRHISAGLSVSTFGIAGLPKFSAAGIAIAGCAIWQMYLVMTKAQLAFARPDDKPGCGIPEYLELRQAMLRLFMVAALILGLGTVGSATLRNAVNSHMGNDYFPADYVIIYGAMYSILLLVAYVPVQIVFHTVGTRLRDHLCRPPDPTPAGIKAWNEESADLTETLGLRLNAAGLLGPSLATILPVLLGWIANLLSAKSP